MPIVAAAVCPHPPLIVPEIASGAASELDNLRDACGTAVHRLRSASPDTVLVVGGSDRTGRCSPHDAGTLAPWGVPVEVPLVPSLPRGERNLPLSVTIGAWLLRQHPIGGVRVGAATVDMAALPAQAAAFGARECAGSADRVALLVMGDGSACRGQNAAGYADPRAQPYDTAVARALATVDIEALLAIDPAISAELLVAGRAAWQVLAGAVRASVPDSPGDPPATGWRGEVLYDAAPYGVSYFVASWERV